MWGTGNRSQRQPDLLAGDVHLLGAVVSRYDVVLVGMEAVVAVLLRLLIHRTRTGRSVRAIAQDATMAQAIGVDARAVLVLVFALGSLLAGFAGGLMVPNVSVSPSLGNAFVLQCFAVVIVGGLGSVAGSLVAALLVGVAETAAVAWVPALTGFTFYVLVAVVLLVRPQGLLGDARTRRA
ncbi:hypothetical protein GCM10025868_09370 [Angustibacter aerolatus]|uniref:Branched-chain amino acid ABC transporter permease n=1 Tax=Angustibacter aerolatus TaxID=1162965 RepID=A0ABQ6JD39_9ACTN|nr:branched-chain amino acid ABC transporter permease [Angustibacter aerolatus]GMA85687.1 hypothetical protein GCM10025868_09370 [Angustibacter aerolatus]